MKKLIGLALAGMVVSTSYSMPQKLQNFTDTVKQHMWPMMKKCAKTTGHFFFNRRRPFSGVGLFVGNSVFMGLYIKYGFIRPDQSTKWKIVFNILGTSALTAAFFDIALFSKMPKVVRGSSGIAALVTEIAGWYWLSQQKAPDDDSDGGMTSDNGEIKIILNKPRSRQFKENRQRVNDKYFSGE